MPHCYHCIATWGVGLDWAVNVLLFLSCMVFLWLLIMLLLASGPLGKSLVINLLNQQYKSSYKISRSNVTHTMKESNSDHQVLFNIVWLYYGPLFSVINHSSKHSYPMLQEIVFFFSRSNYILPRKLTAIK